MNSHLQTKYEGEQWPGGIASVLGLIPAWGTCGVFEQDSFTTQTTGGSISQCSLSADLKMSFCQLH